MRKKTMLMTMITAGVLVTACGNNEQAGTDTAAVTETASETIAEDDAASESLEDKVYPEHPVLENEDGTYSLDGIKVSLGDIKVTSTSKSDTEEQVIFATDDGAYALEYSPVTYTEISEKEVREMYQLTEGSEDITATGGTWTISTRDSDSIWDFIDPDTGETLFSYENGDVMASATNVYTNSEGDVATRTIAYAAHDGNVKLAVEQIVLNLSNTNAE